MRSFSQLCIKELIPKRQIPPQQQCIVDLITQRNFSRFAWDDSLQFTHLCKRLFRSGLCTFI